jgi:hypothetical protein
MRWRPSKEIKVKLYKKGKKEMKMLRLLMKTLLELRINLWVNFRLEVSVVKKVSKMPNKIKRK